MARDSFIFYRSFRNEFTKLVIHYFNNRKSILHYVGFHALRRRKKQYEMVNRWDFGVLNPLFGVHFIGGSGLCIRSIQYLTL